MGKEVDFVRIDFMRIDLVGVDLVRIDLVGVPRYVSLNNSIRLCVDPLPHINCHQALYLLIVVLDFVAWQGF